LKIEPEAKYLLILSTAPNIEVAKSIAMALLEKHLIACANLNLNVERIYRWQGKIEEATEVLMVMKTTAGKHAAALDALQALHPYDTPEGVAVPIVGGLERYLGWVGDQCDSLG